ncbi:MAG: prephenate dehydrogenase [Vulcanimicrobiaceae bacterium]
MSTLGIIGVGSIGGSIALAARRAGWNTIGYDRDPRASDCASVQEAYAVADAIVIATHVDATVALLRELASKPPLRAGLIMDIASVKVPIVDAATGLPSFVATHPMAGSERSGRDAARADLFDGRTWAYVPSGDVVLDERACALIAQLGARPYAVDAHEHDRVVALTSHVPQLLASVVAAHIHELSHVQAGVVDGLCGPAARELLRLGRSDIDMWRDILRANAGEVVPHLRAFVDDLGEIAAELASGEVTAAERIFALANSKR